MIKRMQFAGVWISDPDKAYDFYVNKLGFQVQTDAPIGEDNRFLLLVPPGGGTQIAMTKPMPGKTGAQVGGFTNIAFETDDIQATYEELRAKGVQFTQPPTQQFWGRIEALFVDSDGNLFMLHQTED